MAQVNSSMKMGQNYMPADHASGQYAKNDSVQSYDCHGAVGITTSMQNIPNPTATSYSHGAAHNLSHATASGKFQASERYSSEDQMKASYPNHYSKNNYTNGNGSVSETPPKYKGKENL